MNLSWVTAGFVKDELFAWEGLCKRKTNYKIIHLIIFWIIWKERNNRAFEGKKSDFVTIKNKWLHLFWSIVLGHNLDNIVDFASLVNTLTVL